MEQLKTVIQKLISTKPKIDWLIVHDISKSNIKIDGVEFSFVDGKERQDEPFKTNQGYISLKTLATIKEFTRIATELSEEFKSNSNALANLFIIVTRVSHKGDAKETLIKNFKKKSGKKSCQSVYDLLITSLNSEYYKNNHLIQNPATTNEWLDLFHSAQYLHGFSDPIINCLQLVRSKRNRQLDFTLLEKMKPLLRSVLMGFYGFNLSISVKKLKLLYKKGEELTFLSASLIDDSGPDKIPPEWLTKTLVEIFLETHWDTIGKQIFVHVFGLSFRNKSQNKLYEKLEDFIHLILLKQLLSDKSETHKWINKFEFPGDFIAFFGWLSSKKIESSEIPNANRDAILSQFINELQRILKAIPVHLASENNSDPFSSFQLHENKYQTALAYILVLLLYATDKNRKDLYDVCFEVKPLFYGGYRARSLATHFTELLLLIGLSGNRINGLDENEYSSLKEYLKILADTVLIPYIHLAERNDEIWNPESEKEVFQFNAGRYLIITALASIQKHEIRKYYQDFFTKINETKIAKWNYHNT